MARKKKPPSRKRGKRTGKKGRGKSRKKQPKQTRQKGAAAEAPAEEPSVGSAEADAGAGTATLEAPSAAAVVDSQDDVTVVDLDADIDDGGATDEVELLIAETLAIAPEEDGDADPDEPAIDLDAELGEAPGERPVTETEAAPTEAEPAPTEAAPAPADSARQEIDLGPVSSSEVRDRLLAAALAHAEHKDARYRVPFAGPTSTARWKLLAASVVLLAAGVAAVAPPGWARPDPPAQLGAADRAHSLRVALVLQAQQVEAFRVRAQRLPAALDEVGAVLPGVRYVRSGNRAYQLIVYEADGNAIVYDSASPIDAPGALGAGWAAPEVAP